MNKLLKPTLTAFVLFALSFVSIGQSVDAIKIVEKADKLLQGNSSISEMTMKIVRPSWTRTVTFKNWGKGHDLALTLIEYPKADKGQTFLKRGNEMWTWNPKINRLIKLPPSMLSQGWMGSDYTNDDILKESSIVKDYTHKIIKSVKYQNYDCWVVELMPKEEAAVVWGKIVEYITKDSYLTLKQEYYDEDFDLVKSHINSDVKKMDDRTIPTKTIVQPADEPDKHTEVIIKSVKFNSKMSDNFFSQQNMKRIR